MLFADASFGLFRGEKVGITGENGSGKSSLLSLVRGELHPDSGSFDMPPGLAVAHVAQELLASDAAAIEFVLDGDAELRGLQRDIAAAEAADDGCPHRGAARALCRGRRLRRPQPRRPAHAWPGIYRPQMKCARCGPSPGVGGCA